MKKIPTKVLAACAISAASIVAGGTLALASPELKFASQTIVWFGLLAVVVETFGWGAREGYAIRGQLLVARVEHALRCAVMSVIMILVSVIIAAPIQQAVFELFFRK